MVSEKQSGKRFGRYEIRSKLGAGGMGEVYLAHDGALGRDVALKVLPAEFLENPDRLTRFRQEARAASALNHPNILTIYEIGESEHGWFIATEFVNGDTLRQFIRREKQIPLLQAIKLAGQLADALASAHEAGIVHRDIKPENIMIRRDGIVKILDFGLAKPTQFAAAPEDATLEIVKTLPGIVMGSVRYMSPEQARGKEVDCRTDLWSLGVVLFEMLVGKPPFDGETTSDTLAALIYQEPAAIAALVQNPPPELERIVCKSLRKDAAERYQTAREFAFDLQTLREEIEHAAIHESRISGENRTAVFAAHNSTETAAHRTSDANRSTYISDGTNSAQTNSQIITGYIVTHRWQTVFASLGAVLLFSAAGYGFYNFFRKPANQTVAAFQKTQISRIATDGKTKLPALSADGKYIAYLSGEQGSRTLVVRQVATDSIVTVAPQTALEFRSIAFSPNGDYLFYVQMSKDYSLGTLYQIPTLGGVPKKILEDVDSGVSFSPDGKRIAFQRHQPQESSDVIFTANADGSNLQPLVSSKQTEFNFFLEPAWSPDGSKILVGTGNSKDDENKGVQFAEINLTDGKIKLFNPKKWTQVADYRWLGDNSGFLLTAKENEEAAQQIWRVDYPNGEFQAVTNDLNNYFKIGVSNDGSTLVSIESDTVSTIWSFNPANKELTQILPESRDLNGDVGIVQLPDGKLVFGRYSEKDFNFWTIEPTGANQQRLTNETGYQSQPHVSPDGKFVVFNSTRGGSSKIWRMNADGTNAVQLTAENTNHGDYSPQITSDGKTVIFQRFVKGSNQTGLYKIAFAGGAETPIFDDKEFANYMPRLSPDGKHLAFVAFNNRTFKKTLRVTAFDGENVGRIENDFDYNLIQQFAWSPDSKSLTCLSAEGTPNLWKMPLDGKPPQPVTDFKSGRVFNFAWSTDGKRLFLVRGIVNNDLVLIKDVTKTKS